MNKLISFLIILIIIPTFLLFGQTKIKVEGKLLGSDGNPVNPSHVSVIYGSMDVLSVTETNKDGNFSFLIEPGAYELLFSAPNHTPLTVPFLLENKNVNLEVHLSAYEYVENFDSVRVLGNFNDFSWGRKVSMQKENEDKYSVTIETDFLITLLFVSLANVVNAS